MPETFLILRTRSNDVSVDPWLNTEEEKSKKASEKPENLLSTKEHLRFFKDKTKIK